MCHHYDVSLTEWICQCRYGIIVLLADGTRPTDANQLLVLVAVLLTQYSLPLLVILYVPSFSCSAHPIALRKSTTPEMNLLSLSQLLSFLCPRHSFFCSGVFLDEICYVYLMIWILTPFLLTKGLDWSASKPL